MTAILWLGAVTAGLTITVGGSRKAVTNATELARGTRLPPFFIGMTLLALGTDLPEIANSVVASYTNHGDVNVGDSIGSASTQLTLVLGILPFAGFAIPLGERGSALLKGQQTTVWLTAVALIGVAVLMIDDHIGRLDAVVLIAAWVAGSRLVYGETRIDQQVTLDKPAANRPRLAGQLLLAILAIGAGATLAVTGIIELARTMGTAEAHRGLLRSVDRHITPRTDRRLHRLAPGPARSCYRRRARVLVRRRHPVGLGRPAPLPNRHRRKPCPSRSAHSRWRSRHRRAPIRPRRPLPTPKRSDSLTRLRAKLADSPLNNRSTPATSPYCQTRRIYSEASHL